MFHNEGGTRTQRMCHDLAPTHKIFHDLLVVVLLGTLYGADLVGLPLNSFSTASDLLLGNYNVFDVKAVCCIYSFSPEYLVKFSFQKLILLYVKKYKIESYM